MAVECPGVESAFLRILIVMLMLLTKTPLGDSGNSTAEEYDLKNIYSLSFLDGTGPNWTEINQHINSIQKNLDIEGTVSDWTEILYQHINNSIQNQNKQQYGSSHDYSHGIIATAVMALVSFLIGAYKFSKRKKAEGPGVPQPNSVPKNQVENISEQPHCHRPAPGTLGIPTPYSVNQSWNTRISQPETLV